MPFLRHVHLVGYHTHSAHHHKDEYDSHHHQNNNIPSPNHPNHGNAFSFGLQRGLRAAASNSAPPALTNTRTTNKQTTAIAVGASIGGIVLLAGGFIAFFLLRKKSKPPVGSTFLATPPMSAAPLNPYGNNNAVGVDPNWPSTSPAPPSIMPSQYSNTPPGPYPASPPPNPYYPTTPSPNPDMNMASQQWNQYAPPSGPNTAPYNPSHVYSSVPNTAPYDTSLAYSSAPNRPNRPEL